MEIVCKLGRLRISNFCCLSGLFIIYCITRLQWFLPSVFVTNTGAKSVASSKRLVKIGNFKGFTLYFLILKKSLAFYKGEFSYWLKFRRLSSYNIIIPYNIVILNLNSSPFNCFPYKSNLFYNNLLCIIFLEIFILKFFNIGIRILI